MPVNFIETSQTSVGPDAIEVVERKGIGHPDTLADLVAETFSNLYSQHCLERFGAIANHAVDKVTLIGGTADVDFGKCKLRSPIQSLLVGKVTRAVGDVTIPIEDLFRKSVKKVFSRVLAPRVMGHVEIGIALHDSIGRDHPGGFYQPESIEELHEVNRVLRANDTVACYAFADYSPAERLAIDLENFVNGSEFKSAFPETGTDVKVMVFRNHRELEITLCLPFLAERVRSATEYSSKLRFAHATLQRWLDTRWLGRTVLLLNTKDEGGEFAYLTAFGSALDKGDSGAVGRGNRYNGLITPNRPMSIEAVAGKNPVHHSGKLYSTAAFALAHEVWLRCETGNTVSIVARNGDPLAEPAHVTVGSERSLNLTKRREIEREVRIALSQLGRLTQEIVQADPVAEHRERSIGMQMRATSRVEAISIDGELRRRPA